MERLVTVHMGRAIDQAVSRRLPTAAARVRAQSGHLGFVVDKVALGQVYSKYFGFRCQFALYHFLHNHHHHLSSGIGTIGQTVAAVPSGLNLAVRLVR
jgi:hypothetical protein